VRVQAISLLALAAIVAMACSSTSEIVRSRLTPSLVPTVVAVAAEPPLVAPNRALRFVSTPSSELRAEDPATGDARWTLTHSFLAGGAPQHWRVLVSSDGASVYVQSLADGPTLTYLGTRRVDARTGSVLADDIKNEIHWYENVVLWTALGRGGELQMAIVRAPTAGGGYLLRTLDPLTLKTLSEIALATPPPTPSR